MPTTSSPIETVSVQKQWRLLQRIVVLFILGLAFALRVWQLDAQSLWHDEGLSWWFAREPLWQMLRSVAGTEHPPLYFFALGVWMRLAGDSAYALRFFSVMGGVLTVAGLMAVTRRWRWVSAGLLAALFLAWNPFHIWYSQEVRSYAWISAIALWVVYAGWQWQRRGQRRDGVIYTLAAGVALYVHPFLVFLLMAQGLLLGSVYLRQKRAFRALLKGFWPFLIGGVLFFPWLWPTLQQLGTNRTYWYWGYLDVGDVVKATAEAFAYYNLPADLMPVYVPRLTFLFWLFAAVGTALVWKKRERVGHWVAASMWLPVVFTLVLAYFVPKYAPRYVIYALPWWLLLVVTPAIAVVQWTRQLRDAVVACMAGTFLVLLITAHGVTSWHVRELTMQPEVARPDFRGSVGFVQEKAQPGDAIVLVGGHMEPVVRYYLRRGDVSFYPLPRRLLVDLAHPLTWSEAASALNEITAKTARVWGIFWQEDLADPQRLIFSVLQTYACPVITPAMSPGVDVGLYLVPQPLKLPDTPVPQHKVGIRFRNGLEFVGFDAARVFPPNTSVDFCMKVRRQHRAGVRVAAGETLYVVMFLRPTSPLAADLTGFVHLVSPTGDKAFALTDKLLGGYAYPVWRWHPGEVVRQEFPLLIPRDLPPGQYALEIGLYHPKSLQRVDPLPAEVDGARVDGSRILYAPVEVLPPWQ